MGESQAELCEQPGACLDQGGLNRKNFSKSKRENRGTQRLVRELSAAASASGAPPPSGPGLGTQDKQPQLSPEAWLDVPRLADWAPTTETPVGHPHLKPWVGAHQEQRPAAPHTAPKQQTWPDAPPRPNAVDPLINGLAACEGPHLKAPILKNSYLVPVHRALQGLLAL